MARENSQLYKELEKLEAFPFHQRFPWIGGDLQTLRDTLRPELLTIGNSKQIEIAVPEVINGIGNSGKLLALFNMPDDKNNIKGLVLLLHGLGGSSRRQGLKRMTISLLNNKFAVLRLNLRGAEPGRHLAAGTYSANCSSDLYPVLRYARLLCKEIEESTNRPPKSIPLYGAGISLGGTMLLNICLDERNQTDNDSLTLDRLICTSSPLDLAECSRSIERPRNRLYQKWLLKRLIRQTLADPFGISPFEKQLLTGQLNKKIPTSIREFDAAITAPRWGYKDVDEYYKNASPIKKLLKNPKRLPHTLILQSIDDPWVPANTTKKLAGSILSMKDPRVNILLTTKGGHNGFHGIHGCWGDQIVSSWLKRTLAY